MLFCECVYGHSLSFVPFLSSSKCSRPAPVWDAVDVFRRVTALLWPCLGQRSWVCEAAFTSAVICWSLSTNPELRDLWWRGVKLNLLGWSLRFNESNKKAFWKHWVGCHFVQSVPKVWWYYKIIWNKIIVAYIAECAAMGVFRSRITVTVHPKIKLLSWFTNPFVFSNLYNWLSSAEHIIRPFEKCW